MKYWEAMKLIDEGKKVRHKSWADGCFIYKDYLGNVVCADGESYVETFIIVLMIIIGKYMTIEKKRQNHLKIYLMH